MVTATKSKLLASPSHYSPKGYGRNYPCSPKQQQQQQQQLPMYESPRCDHINDDPSVPVESLQTHEDRWNHVSAQAGSHRQDGSLLVIPRRVDPQSLRSGVPPLAARRVRALHVPINETKDSLPEWLDMIDSIFFNLEHVYLTERTETPLTSNTEHIRIRRLYVLYRLPGLISIDGKAVTEVERQLARPLLPSGFKVRREEWVPYNHSLITDDSDDSQDETHDHGDAIEVSLLGAVSRTRADIPPEEGAEGWNQREGLFPQEQNANQLGNISAPTIAALSNGEESVAPNVDESTVASCGILSLPYFNSALPTLSLERAPEQVLSETTANKPLSEQIQTLSETSLPNPNASSEEDVNNSFIVNKGKPAPNSPFLSSDGAVELRFGFQSFGGQRDLSLSNSDLLPVPEKETQMSDTQIPAASEGAPAVPSAKRASPSRSQSLTSPFPMQFREKKNVLPNDHDCATGRPLSLETITSDKNASDESPNKRTQTWRTNAPEKEDENSVECTLEKSSLAEMSLKKDMSILGTSNRPPKSPASRRLVATPTRRSDKGKRGLGQWMNRKSMVSTSIVDCDEEDSSTDEEESL